MNIAKFLRASILKNICKRLLLSLANILAALIDGEVTRLIVAGQRKEKKTDCASLQLFCFWFVKEIIYRTKSWRRKIIAEFHQISFWDSIQETCIPSVHKPDCTRKILLCTLLILGHCCCAKINGAQNLKEFRLWMLADSLLQKKIKPVVF